MNADALLLSAIGLGLSAAAAAPFYLRQRRLERETAERAEQARRAGLHEPVTLHPVVDPERCIGSGGCIAACPEQVLGLRDGQAVAIQPARCVGHGLCERACPMEAIRLVFGTATRGVEIPRIREDFQTNVPGLHIIGELGGMGLIRNAFEQGRQCIAALAAEPAPTPAGAADLAIIGCGPAGLSASLHALHRGLRFVTLEREDIGGTVRHYPRRKIVLTGPLHVPGYGQLALREIEKERLVELWQEIVERTGLQVRTGETVTAVHRREDGAFHVRTHAGDYTAARVVLAIGRRGIPRKLGVPGEDSHRVAYSLLEPEAFRGERCLVVGGGDSAIEAALALAAEPGTRVWLSYRGERVTRAKPANRERLDHAIAGGRIEALWSSQLVEIREGEVDILAAADDVATLPATRVFIFAGGELPARFLRECGVEIDVKFGRP